MQIGRLKAMVKLKFTNIFLYDLSVFFPHGGHDMIAVGNQITGYRFLIIGPRLRADAGMHNHRMIAQKVLRIAVDISGRLSHCHLQDLPVCHCFIPSLNRNFNQVSFHGRMLYFYPFFSLSETFNVLRYAFCDAVMRLLSTAF